MRVIYSIGAKFAGGGIGTTAYYGARGLYQHGMLYRLLCGFFRPTEIPRRKIRTMGFLSRILRRLAVYDPAHRFSYFHNLLYDTWAAWFLDDGDLFHVWGNHGLRSLRRAKSLGMVTVVQWASSYPVWRRQLLREEYRQWGIKFYHPVASVRRSLSEIEMADYVLIPSEFVRRSFVKYGVIDEKLVLIPFGVDIEYFHPLNSNFSRPFRALFLGQVGIRKGILYLLEAWRQLKWKDAELWIVGRPSAEFLPMMKRYRDLIGLRWQGYVDDPVTVYQQADVFVFPSLEEGSALVTYEALACGLPVITTPNAGSVVRDGVEGFIVPIRDVEGLAAALERLRVDERLRRDMSRAARAQAEKFTWKRHGDALAKVYQHLISRRRGE